MTPHNCVEDWGKVAPRQGWGREVPGRVRVGDAKFAKLGKDY